MFKLKLDFVAEWITKAQTRLISFFLIRSIYALESITATLCNIVRFELVSVAEQAEMSLCPRGVISNNMVFW